MFEKYFEGYRFIFLNGSNLKQRLLNNKITYISYAK